MLRGAAACAVLATLVSACSLTEVTTAPGEDVIVVQAVLRTDQARQEVLLAHSLQGTIAGPVPSASVTVTGPDGVPHAFVETSGGCYSLSGIYVTRDSLDFQGTCYESADSAWLRPAAVYDLLVRTADGRVIRGRSRVPGAFSVPALATTTPCSLAPDSAFTLRWTQSDSAYGYVADLNVAGLSGTLGGRGFDVPDPLELQGISVSRADTTILLPTEFGVFDRFQLNDQLLLAIRSGFPAGTRAEVVVAAMDRNWVNSARGGSFNPSGQVHVSTVTGDGVGLFGAANVHRGALFVESAARFPRCATL